MELQAKIYVAGHRGMVGSAIVRELHRQGYTNLVTRTHAELDLCDQQAVNAFFEAERPGIRVSCCGQSRWHCGKRKCTGRLHVRKHDARNERHPCSMEERLPESANFSALRASIPVWLPSL